VVDAPARNAIALREGPLDLAFLTPIDYARESSLYHIVPGIAVASQGGDGTIALLFRERLDRLRSLAIDPSSASEIILARIVLAEQFDLRPTMIPYQGAPGKALANTDAVLVIGDTALRMLQEHDNSLDLVEEWEGMTTLPYVHGIWCGRENAASTEDLSRLLELCTEGRGNLDALSEAAARDRRLGSLSALRIREYLEGLRFDGTEEIEEGLREFMRYAYYHGALPDVPDLQYYGSRPAGEADQEPRPAPSAVH
jgi:predicted solute-binding protein